MNTSIFRSPALVLLTNNGKRVPVCGSNLQVALWAAALADIVLRRGEVMPIPLARTGGLSRVRVTANTVSRLLLNVYGSEPATIAEAIMALRKMRRGRAGWLQNVLNKRPELSTLAKAVHTELTGEIPESPGQAAA